MTEIDETTENAQAADGKPADGKPAGDKSAGGKPVDAKVFETLGMRIAGEGIVLEEILKSDDSMTAVEAALLASHANGEEKAAKEGDAASEEEGKPKRSRSQKLNMVLIGVAFVVLFGYLFIAGEGTEVMDAVARFSYPFLLLALVFMVVYWLLEAVCMQMLVTHLHPGFAFIKQFLNTLIGQYFNCITPLSSGGQPMQAYYYQRFGLPLSEAMTTLLCRFIVYQMTTTVYCAIVLVLRFTYFTEQLAPVMTLVIIGFCGGLVLMAALLALAFWRSGTTKFAMWCIRVLGKLHIMKNPEAAQAEAKVQLDDAYDGVHRLFAAPKLLFKVAGVTFVQLTVFFSVSFVIYLGFGLQGSDYLTVISCQAFVYMISSFIPLPGAIGAAEGSYIAFFSYIYPDGGLTAYSTFIWRLFTFYLPIVIGMYITVAVNNPKSWLAKRVGIDKNK